VFFIRTSIEKFIIQGTKSKITNPKKWGYNNGLRVQERKKKQKIKIILIVTTIALLLAACGGNQASQTPTISVSDIQTMAVSSFVLGLTQTAQALPTPIPTDTPVATNTILAFSTFAPLSGSGTPGALLTSPTASCYGLAFANVETITDGTKMKAGEKFTKSWTVQNTGGCAWQVGFKFTLISGNPMGGSTVTLPIVVNPQAQYQISIPMIAPATAGEAKGTWRMEDASSSFFGESIWVDIAVEGTTATKTPTATPTP